MRLIVLKLRSVLQVVPLGNAKYICNEHGKPEIM